jgi:3-hydroxybutyryl-CoA dehydrogenase
MPETIGIVGTGGMGRGIAEVAAVAGYRTVLVKPTSGEVSGARDGVAASLDRAVKKGKLSAEAADEALGRITFTRDLDALSDSRIVVESIIEDLACKRALFAALEPRVGAQAVLASNTSSLPIGALADGLKAPNRFIGLHFFSPVPAMKLVEIGTTARTYPNAVEEAQRFATQLGKTPILVGPSSGYIVNRLLLPYLLDAISTLENGLARAEAIDTAMKLGCGHPMGPLALADAIGLDVVYAMARSLHRELGDRRYTPPALLRRLILNGQLGKKTGLGLYDYRGAEPLENADLWPVPAVRGAAT